MNEGMRVLSGRIGRLGRIGRRPRLFSSMRTLREDGFTVLETAVPAATARQALAEVHSELAELEASWAYSLRRFFDIVNSPHHRHSFPVQLTPGVLQTIRGVVGKLDPSLFQEMVGKNGILVELSALVTYPGAQSQALHTDIPFNALPEDKETGCPPLCSVFVALQDIDRDMGPTMILKGTHQKGFHSTIRATQESYDSSGNLEVLPVSTANNAEEKEDGPSAAPFSDEQMFDAALPCTEGSVYVMDSRCAHAGGANVSASTRTVLCFAFQRDTQPMERARGFTYHIRAELEKEKLRLTSFQ